MKSRILVKNKKEGKKNLNFWSQAMAGNMYFISFHFKSCMEETI